LLTQPIHASALSTRVDAAIMVVRAFSEKRGMIARMMRQFESQQAELLGVILNGVQSSAGGYFRKNYEAFYRYRQGNRPTRSSSAAQE